MQTDKAPPRLLLLAYLALDLPVFLYLSLLHWQNFASGPHPLLAVVPAAWLTLATLSAAALVVLLSNTKSSAKYARVGIRVITPGCAGLRWAALAPPAALDRGR
jgi:hypothetical protein